MDRERLKSHTMALTETERMISFYPQGETFLRREQVFAECLTRIKSRGVHFNPYCLGVEYQDTQEGLGGTAPEIELSPQIIKVSQLSWIEANRKKMPVTEVLEAVIEHEFIHEVHRSRVARGLTEPLMGDALEFVVHAVQLDTMYRKNRAHYWSKKVMKWLSGANRSRTSDNILGTYGYIIGSEFQNGEYLFALGL